MNIYEKINKVREKISYVQKDTQVGFGQNSFKAVSHDQVTSVARQHFVDQGIVIVPSQVEKGVAVEGITKSGSPKIRFEAMYKIKFVNIEDKDDFIDVVVEAHAEGSDDKCPGKALSYATKSAMLKVLMLETGEDDEGGAKNTIDIKQAGMLAQLITDTGTDINKFCEAYKISTVAELPSGAFTQALSQLQTKAKKQKAAQ